MVTMWDNFRRESRVILPEWIDKGITSAVLTVYSDYYSLSFSIRLLFAMPVPATGHAKGLNLTLPVWCQTTHTSVIM